MIRYTLVCDNDHQFESWFRDSASYDGQVKEQLVTCPTCGSPKVDKAIMAPAVARTDRERTARLPGANAPAPAAILSEKDRKLHEMLRALRRHVVENADYVGERFPEEARRMHAGEIEERAIYGEATPEDTRSLLEEGIEVLPLPIVPEDRN